MLIDHLTRKRLEREGAGLWRQRRIVEDPCGPVQQVSSHLGETGTRLAFSSNDYLGLANHPDVVAALAEGAHRWGAGSGASHLVSGHSRAHADLEATLAARFASFIPDARALLFCSGFAANLALLTTLGDGAATIFADKLNHASLIDGGLLARARMHRYPHARLDVLAAVTDAVFSMDGDIAPLPDLLALAHAHDAWLIVDDAHGFGVLGQCGLGALEHFGLKSERLIIMGTLGKAAGVSGAFVAAHPAVIEALIQGGRSYIYTTAMPPALAHALLTSVALITGAEGVARRARLQQNIAQLRSGLEHIIDALDTAGLWVPAIRPPTVPPGSARLRITVSATHCVEDIERLCATLMRFAITSTNTPAESQ